MKINSNPFDGIRQAVESGVEKAKETIESKAESVVEKTKDAVNDNGVSAQKLTPESVAKEARSLLDMSGSLTRSKMDKLFDTASQHAPSLKPKEGSLLGDIALGAREGADAGQTSGRNAAVDTHAKGPKGLAGFAGGLIGGISGAIDGFNGHVNGSNSDEIRKEARANGDYAGGVAGQRSMFLDNNAGENATYPEYKEYQANGGTKSYDEWMADTHHYSGTGGHHTIVGGASTPNPNAGNANNNNNNPTTPTPPPANNGGGPVVPIVTGGEGDAGAPEETPPADGNPPVVYGDQDKDYTVYVDTSSVQSDGDAVDDLI